MWRTVIYIYGHLGVRCFKIGDFENALKNFRKCAELARQFDGLDRITVMHSVLFEGKEFDKHTSRQYIHCQNAYQTAYDREISAV